LFAEVISLVIPVEEIFWEFLAEMQAKAFETHLYELQSTGRFNNSIAQETDVKTKGEVPTNNILVSRKCGAEYRAGGLFGSGCAGIC
jgi:hypothetical protein